MMTGIVIDKVRVSCMFFALSKRVDFRGASVRKALWCFYFSYLIELAFSIYIYIYIAIQLLIRNNKKIRKYWKINRKKMPRVSLCNCLDKSRLTKKTKSHDVLLAPALANDLRMCMYICPVCKMAISIHCIYYLLKQSCIYFIKLSWGIILV